LDLLGHARAGIADVELDVATGTFVGAALCAYDRSAMLNGAANSASICFMISNDGNYLPSDLDGSTLPPTGAPGYFLNFPMPNVRPLSTLRLYQLAPNFPNPSSSTLSAPLDITVASFHLEVSGNRN
jgi:hypothetical protein